MTKLNPTKFYLVKKQKHFNPTDICASTVYKFMKFKTL